MKNFVLLFVWRHKHLSEEGETKKRIRKAQNSARYDIKLKKTGLVQNYQQLLEGHQI